MAVAFFAFCYLVHIYLKKTIPILSDRLSTLQQRLNSKFEPHLAKIKWLGLKQLVTIKIRIYDSSSLFSYIRYFSRYKIRYYYSDKYGRKYAYVRFAL